MITVSETNGYQPENKEKETKFKPDNDNKQNIKSCFT